MRNAYRAAGWNRRAALQSINAPSTGSRPTATPSPQASSPAGFQPRRTPCHCPFCRRASATKAPMAGAKMAPMRLKISSIRPAQEVAIRTNARTPPIRAQGTRPIAGQCIDSRRLKVQAE